MTLFLVSSSFVYPIYVVAPNDTITSGEVSRICKECIWIDFSAPPPLNENIVDWNKGI